MKKEIQIWNLLHDGDITVHEVNGDQLTLFVCIPWMRKRIKPLGDSFVLKMTGVTKAEFHDYEGNVSTIAEELDLCVPEILSTESEAMPISVMCTTNTLVLDYQDISFALDSGEPVSYEGIEKACHDYWDEWKKKTEPAG